MTDMERPRSDGGHGDVDDLDGVSAELIPRQLRRRRAASWRCNPLQSGHRDPWHYPATEPVTERELASWRAAWRHLHGLGLPAVVPERVLAAGQAHRRDGAS